MKDRKLLLSKGWVRHYQIPGLAGAGLATVPFVVSLSPAATSKGSTHVQLPSDQDNLPPSPSASLLEQRLPLLGTWYWSFQAEHFYKNKVNILYWPTGQSTEDLEHIPRRRALQEFLLSEVFIMDILGVVFQILHVCPKEIYRSIPASLILGYLPNQHISKFDEVTVILILHLHYSPGVQPTTHTLAIHL